jgi:hypothetical protein
MSEKMFRVLKRESYEIDFYPIAGDEAYPQDMLDRIVNMIARGGRLSDEQYKGNPIFVVNLAHPDVPSIPNVEFAVTYEEVA